MASRSPSLMALLGLAAVAGYQNRDKLSEFFGQLAEPATRHEDSVAATRGTGDFDMNSAFGSAPVAGMAGALVSGLSELIRNAGAIGGETARKLDSWVGTGQNAPASGADIRALLGEETLRDLAARTGLAIPDLESRLASILPEAVNQMTPDGRIPGDDQVSFNAASRA